MAKTLAALIDESGASSGDLVYIRSSLAITIPGGRLTTAPDLLGLKAEAATMSEPLIAVGPGIDETYADIVIDAESPEPSIVKAKSTPEGPGQPVAGA